MTTYREAAAAMLHAGGPLNYREIVRMAVDHGLLESYDAKTKSTMFTTLNADIRNKGASSPFVKTGPGMFDLHPTLKAEFGGQDYTGRPAYGRESSRRKKAPGTSSKRAAGTSSKRAAGRTSKRAAGRTSKRAAGTSSKRAAGRTSKRAAGRTSKRAAGTPPGTPPGGSRRAAGRGGARQAAAGGARDGARQAEGGPGRSAAGRARRAGRITGGAGVHAVLCELLFRGFDAAMMSGGGSDVIARRGGGTYRIRVSTSDGANVTVRTAGFGRPGDGPARLFYILVIRLRDGRNRFIIMPQQNLEHCTERGFVRLADGAFSASVTMGGGRAHLGDGANDVSHLVDNWDAIR